MGADLPNRHGLDKDGNIVSFTYPDEYRWVDEMAEALAKYNGPTCECGVSITLGEANDDPQFHSDWCPVYKKRGVP